MSRRFPLAFLLGFLIAGMGCVPSATLQTASSLGKGHTEVAVEPTLLGGMDVHGSGNVEGLPALSLAVRHGLTDRLDLGGRVGPGGLELTSKFLLSDPGHPSLAVSLVPSAAWGTGGWPWISISVPLLVGIKAPAGSELVFGPKLHFTSDPGTTLNVLSMGGSLAYAWRVSPRLALMPEISVLAPTLGREDALAYTDVGPWGWSAFWQVSFSVMFGT